MIVFNSQFSTIQEVQEQIPPLQAQLQSYEEELKIAEQQYGKDSVFYEVEKRFVDGCIKDIRLQIFIHQALIRAMILNQAFVSPPQAKTYPPKKCLKA